MKRMLSVFLSMVLLVSSVVIPMSVSAVEEVTPEAAFDAVVEAVKNLDLDLNNVNPIEYAVPKGSAGGADNTSKSTVKEVTNFADKATLGGKKVEITGDNNVTSTAGGRVEGHLHAINYQTLSNVYVHLYRVGYFVIYVKTKRSIKLSLGAANDQTLNINFLNGENAIEVPATGEGYTPVAINIQSGIDWTKPVLNSSNAKPLYAAEHVLQRLYVSIQEIGDDNTITPDDGITFGSAFYVPVDENVRDFRFDVTTFRNGGSVKGDVTDRFSELSAKMIAAAEAIDNTHGNYTAESFQALQDAIKTAKELFIAGRGDVVDLFKAEVENLYTLEEVCRPTSVNNVMQNLPSANASEIKINDKPLSDKQQEYFGESLVRVDNTTKAVKLTDKTATVPEPALGDLVKKFKDYKNLYFAVANTGDVQNSVEFQSYNSYYTLVNYINRQDYSSNSYHLILKNGFNLISLYDLSVGASDKTADGVTYSFRDNNVLYYRDYMLKYASEYKEYYDGFNIFRVGCGSLPDGTFLYIGSLMGEKPFDTNAADLTNVDTKAEVFKYYNDHIKGKGYINTDDIEKTFSALGLFKIPVTGLYNPADIEFTGGYTFDAALPGENLTFEINNVPSDVDVSVTYGGETITPTDGVYAIPVADKTTQLAINLSHITTEFAGNQTNFDKYFSEENNLALGNDPVFLYTRDFSDYNIEGAGFKRYGTRSSDACKKFSDGSFSNVGGLTNNASMNFGGTTYNNVFWYRTSDYTKYLNNYEPYNGSNAFEFKDNAGEYDLYTDIIYDLGSVAEINKIQQFTNDNRTLSVYEIFASEKIEDLFNSDSSVVRYQNKSLVENNRTLLHCQQHEFPARKARFVAFRVYYPTMYDGQGGSEYWATVRSAEIAIYGTSAEYANGSRYTVSTAGLEDLWVNKQTLETPTGTESLLKTQNLTVSGKVGGTEKTCNTATLESMHDTFYGSGANVVEFSDYNFRVPSNNPLKNGYTIKRDYDEFTGSPKITFNRDKTKNIDTYLDLTYDLGDFYDVKQFHIYAGVHGAFREISSSIQAYQVYIGDDKSTLYNENNIVVDYENYFNVNGQRITFDKPQAGKYIGVRILMVGCVSNTDLIPKIAEIAAFGTPVAAPTDNELKPNENFNSSAAYIFNDKDANSSVYVKDNEGNPTTEGIETADPGELRTSMRLALRYECHFTDGRPDADTIKLANGDYAKILSKSIIAAKYDANQIYDDKSFGIKPTVPNANVVTSTESLRKYFAIDDTNKTQVSVTLNLKNMKSSLKDTYFVFRGRIVYQTADGSIYACYTQISHPINAESAHGELDTEWFQ